ncbi:MAG: EamA family transporter [Chloroflexota bacterium]
MTSPGHTRASPAAVAVALLIVYVVWGSTYFGIAVMIQTMPPLLAAGARYGLAGTLMLGGLAAHAWWRARGRGAAAERLTAAHWRSAFVVGTLLLLGGNGGVVLAELYIPSGVAAVLVAPMPIWLALFDALVTRRRPSRLVVGGLLAGVIGVAVLVVPVEGLAQINPIGVLLVVGAEISWAAGSVYARHAPLPRSGLLATGLEMLAGGFSLVVVGSLLGEIGQLDVSAFSGESVAAFVYLVIFGSIVAFTAYTWLLAHAPVSTVATYAYVNPIIAVALGAILLSEPITARTLIAGALILGAVVAMVSGRPRDEGHPAPETGGEGAVVTPVPVRPLAGERDS